MENNMIQQMEALTPYVMNNIRILAPHNPLDYYYEEALELAKKDYFFETYNVVVWAGLYLRPKRILEVGTRNGGTLVQLLSTYPHGFFNSPNTSITCVDNWKEWYDTHYSKHVCGLSVMKNLEIMNLPYGDVRFISEDSNVALEHIARSYPKKEFDYILIDGGHQESQAYVDLSFAAKLIAPGGILIFDDIGPKSYNLNDVWIRFKDEYDAEFFFYEKRHRKGVGWAVKALK